MHTLCYAGAGIDNLYSPRMVLAIGLGLYVSGICRYCVKMAEQIQLVFGTEASLSLSYIYTVL